MERETNIKLNLLKGIACIGVVFIHITFPGMFGQIVRCASAFAVPIFYMIAGYYAFGKNDDTIKRRLIKIIKIFIYAYLLFFSYNSAMALKNNMLSSWIAQNYTWMTVIKYVWFCTVDYAIPLWYLIAMIEVYFVWLIAIKLRKQDKLVKLFPVLFVLQILLTMYCETLGLDWFWKVNFVTRAMPWFLVGYYLHTDKAKTLRNIEPYKLTILIIVGCIIVIIPTLFNLSIKFDVVGYIPYSIGLFILSLHNPSRSVCKLIEFIGEKLSLNIYIFHVLVDGILGFVFRHFLSINTESVVYLWGRPIIVLIATICISGVIYLFLTNFRKKRV